MAFCDLMLFATMSERRPLAKRLDSQTSLCPKGRDEGHWFRQPSCLIRMMSKGVSAKPETELDNETLLVLGCGAPVALTYYLASPVIPLYSLNL